MAFMANIRRPIYPTIFQQFKGITVPNRGVRGVIRPIRTKLPQYKKNLQNLPPLTGLLTERVEEFVNIKDFKSLRLRKLAVYKEYMPVKSNTVLLEALFNPENDIDRLLRIIDDNLSSMNSFYLGISFEALCDMVRFGSCEPATILVSPEFKTLCSKTLLKVRFFEADEVLKLVKCLSSLHIPENTLIVQAAFQMARHLINDFNFEELESLLESLQTFEVIQDDKKSLLIALKNSIPKAIKLLEEQKQVVEIDRSTRVASISD